MFGERASRRQRVRAAGADGHDAVVGLDHVAVAGKNKSAFVVGDDQECF